jgi:hypothetical protein
MKDMWVATDWDEEFMVIIKNVKTKAQAAEKLIKWLKKNISEDEADIDDFKFKRIKVI